MSGAITDLLARGALLWDANIYIGGAPIAKTPESAPGLAVSRLLLEAYLFGRVGALPSAD